MNAPDTIYPIAPGKAVVIAKRAIDICAGLAGMSLLAVLFPFIALAIKIDSRGPVFYKQERIGKNRRNKDRRGGSSEKILVIKNLRKKGQDRRQGSSCGKSFDILKFRTMRIDAEANGPQLCSAGVNDPRVTRVGSWLRFFHLDELPQFWCILTGEMSLIGPRPERPFFAEKYRQEIPYYLERMRNVKPGLTGLAQITLGYDTSIQSVTYKYYYDLTYRIAMANFSSWVRMESWIVINTFRYFLNQFVITHFLKGLFIGKKLLLNKANAQLNERKQPDIHIAHPCKLIERINTRETRKGNKLPSFIENLNTQFLV